MLAYCVKCKTKREMKDPKPEFTSSGSPGTRGICPECGTTLFRMGRTPAHDGMTPPENISRKKTKTKTLRQGNLVIVESPAKARTISRYLGKNFQVEASKGHVRDLLRSQLSVDVQNQFEPKYRVPNEKRQVVKELKKKAAQAENIYLATDLDREGEAIAWHLIEAAEIEPERTRRVIFHEITKPAIEQAFSHPRQIDMHLVNAQQARRVLDRLVGYSLSPILWRKVANRLSAGRVQSVALRLIVDREREIEDFVPQEYWSIKAEFRPDGGKESYLAKLITVDGNEPLLGDENDVKPLVADMEKADYVISSIKRGTRTRRAPAPYITSTMQQEASRRMNFSTKRTMTIAQQLYEGIDLGNGEPVGLITYMRTDSTHVSLPAQQEARQYIINELGEEYVPPELPVHKTRAKGAQEAHESIRPTAVKYTPKEIKDFLTRDQYRLYQMIWQRFIASQMSPAIYNTIAVEIEGSGTAHKYILRATGSSIKFRGYLAVYEETRGEFEQDENGDATSIPNDITEGQKQHLLQLLPQQHFTQPPPRFSEASLVKLLEENGIGRPSTYAPTISTLLNRDYVYLQERRLFPTETGVIVTDLLAEHFPEIVDVSFTAKMEEDLDRIAEGSISWTQTLNGFYPPFAAQVEKAEKEMPEVKTDPEYIGKSCPTCGSGQLMIRQGRYGKFICCDNFPDCRYTEPWLEKIGVNCPDCTEGDIVERRTRKGRIFYGCSRYPECEFTSWKKPIITPCPNCGGLLVLATREYAQCTGCMQRFQLDQVIPAEQESNKK